jgi:hypothetical protein
MKNGARKNSSSQANGTNTGERNEQYQRAPAILRQAHEPM